MTLTPAQQSVLDATGKLTTWETMEAQPNPDTTSIALSNDGTPRWWAWCGNGDESDEPLHVVHPPYKSGDVVGASYDSTPPSGICPAFTCIALRCLSCAPKRSGEVSYSLVQSRAEAGEVEGSTWGWFTTWEKA